MLWSHQYLTRLWCVFEVAAYRFYRPDGVLIVKPVFLGMSFFVGFAVCWAVSVSTVFRLACAPIASESAFFLQALMCLYPCQVIAIISLRPFMCRKYALKEQFERFDCRSAQCFMPSDREYIMTSIKTWFGNEENFNKEVRGPLRQEVETQLFANPIQYQECLFVGFPVMCIFLEILVAVIRTGTSMHGIMSVSINTVNMCLFAVPIVIWWNFFLADTFRRPASRMHLDILKNLAVGGLATLITLAFIGIGFLTYKRHAALALVYCAVAGASTLKIFGRCFWSCRRIQKTPSTSSVNLATVVPAHCLVLATEDVGQGVALSVGLDEGCMVKEMVIGAEEIP